MKPISIGAIRALSRQPSRGRLGAIFTGSPGAKGEGEIRRPSAPDGRLGSGAFAADGAVRTS